MVPFSLYTPYFYSFIPNFTFQSGSIASSSMQSFFFYSTLAQGRALRRNHLNSLARKPALLIDCFTDVTPHFLLNRHYRSALERQHLWHKQQPHLRDVRNLFNELFLYPRASVCVLVNSYVSQLLTRTMIGVQVRMGGQFYRTRDREFLRMSDISLFFAEVERYMQRNRLGKEDVFIFLSTDTERVISLFRTRYGMQVVTTKEFEIGHSAQAKNVFHRKGETHVMRAIIDLLILQRADFLVVTRESSFGLLATQLQSNRNSTVDFLDFIQWGKAKKCTVFERSNRSFESVFIGSGWLCLLPDSIASDDS